MAATACSGADRLASRSCPAAPCRPDRAGTDEHDFASLSHHLMQLPGELLDALVVELAIVARKDLRTTLTTSVVARRRFPGGGRRA